MKNKYYLSIAITFVIYACGQKSEADYSPPLKEKIDYQEAKLTIEEQEARNPLQFLEADGQYRPALVGGDYLITGSIKNNATSVTYKDVGVEFIYYSKTNSKIGSEKKTFYEFITPGNSHEFRFKVWTPSGTSTLGWEVVSAKSK